MVLGGGYPGPYAVQSSKLARLSACQVRYSELVLDFGEIRPCAEQSFQCAWLIACPGKVILLYIIIIFPESD
jgi:hypothetical protein